MYRRTAALVLLLNLLWILNGCGGVATPAGSNVRSLIQPTGYTPDVGVPVTIAVAPTSTTNVYAVEDTPPDGWTVSNINEDGSYDTITGKVKWGPFFDNLDRTLSYTATPPTGTAGTQTFAGTGSFDGSDVTITGDRTLDPL